jgi:hypothetical protein
MKFLGLCLLWLIMIPTPRYAASIPSEVLGTWYAIDGGVHIDFTKDDQGNFYASKNKGKLDSEGKISIFIPDDDPTNPLRFQLDRNAITFLLSSDTSLVFEGLCLCFR